MFNLCKQAALAKNSAKYPTYGSVVNWWDEVSGKVACWQVSDGSRKVNVFFNYSGVTQEISAINRGELVECSYGGSATTVGAYGFTVVVSPR